MLLAPFIQAGFGGESHVAIVGDGIDAGLIQRLEARERNINLAAGDGANGPGCNGVKAHFRSFLLLLPGHPGVSVASLLDRFAGRVKRNLV